MANKGGVAGSPILARVVELCDDGRWHDYEWVITEASRLVPPGKAIRRAEKNRRYSGGASGPEERYQTKETHRLIAIGKRSLVAENLRKPWFEINPPGRLPDDQRPFRKIRLVMVPVNIERDRMRTAEQLRVHPSTVVPQLLKGEDAALGDLNRSQLIRVINALVAHIATSESNWLEWG